MQRIDRHVYNRTKKFYIKIKNLDVRLIFLTMLIFKMIYGKKNSLSLSFADAPSDVKLLERVKTGEDAGTGDASQDVGASALHHRHEAFVLHDLNGAVDGSLVFDAGSGGHHHTTPDGVDGVGHEAGGDRHAVAQAEGEEQPGVGAEQNGLQGIVEAEVHSTVDENADARDDESSVEALDAVGLEGLGVYVDETLVLTLAAFALGVVSETGTGVVERVDEEEREGSRASAGEDV